MRAWVRLSIPGYRDPVAIADCAGTAAIDIDRFRLKGWEAAARFRNVVCAHRSRVAVSRSLN